MNKNILEGVLLDQNIELSLSELCRVCSCSEEWIIELVEEGGLDPLIDSLRQRQTIRTQAKQLTFSVNSLEKVRIAMRLQRDLEINLSGVALALELLHEIETLKSRLRRLEL